MAPLSHGKHSYRYRELETKTPGLREGKRGTFRAVVSDIQSMAYVLAISNKLFHYSSFCFIHWAFLSVSELMGIRVWPKLSYDVKKSNQYTRRYRFMIK